MQVSCWLSTVYTTQSIHMLIVCNSTHHIDLDFKTSKCLHLPASCGPCVLCQHTHVYYRLLYSPWRFGFYRLPSVYNLKCLHIKNITTLTFIILILMKNGIYMIYKITKLHLWNVNKFANRFVYYIFCLFFVNHFIYY